MWNRERKIVYVTRDAERALGIDPNPNYMIVAGRELEHSIPPTLKSDGFSVTFPKSQTEGFPFQSTNAQSAIDDRHATADNQTNDTPHLLELKETKKIINDNEAAVLVFKNNQLIEDICKKNGWQLLNPPAALAEKIENKITQVEWLGDLALKYLPPHRIAQTKDLRFDDKKTVIQWAHGHTGDGTVLVNSENELRALQAKFPDRLARVTDFVTGPSFTVNVVVGKDKILTGNISYQITGLAPFTDNPFSTVGNDWSATEALLDRSEIEFIEKMSLEVGGRMRESGWRGIFGIDVMKDEELNKIYLIEINARQPASTTFESILQRSIEPQGTSIFEAHLLALQDQSVNQPLIEINNGAQVIQRVTKKVKSVPKETICALESAGYQATVYPNTAPNSDLVRIQCKKGIIESHGKLNEQGKEMVEILATANDTAIDR